MRTIVLGHAIILILCCCSTLVAEEKGGGDFKTIPTDLLGVWIERGEDGKESGRMTISSKDILWERHGVDIEIIKVQDFLYSDHLQIS